VSRFFSAIFRWLVRQAVTLGVILIVLTGAVLYQGGVESFDKLKSDRASLAARRDGLSKQADQHARKVGERSKKAQFAIGYRESLVSEVVAERQRLRDAHPWARNVPLSEPWIQIQLLDKAIAGHQAALGVEARLMESLKQELDAAATATQREIAQIETQLAAIDDKLSTNYVMRLLAAIREELPIALGILLGIILLPIGTRVFLYFVVAPWVSGRAPIRLLPGASGSVVALGAESGDRGKMSAVSLPVVLGERQELLIQPDYLQSTSLLATKRTRWLLNARFPVASLLSGMCMLTRVSPAGSEPVVISATRDALSEVGIVDLAEGAAFVCQPRSLAGVIQDPQRPIRITRHWRLGSLQAWLTLQLRFLVFHGSGQLVMKGCRGIRIESPGTGRLINQAATLGFSANLAYANTRCETFVSYWTGKEDLFNDSFAGTDGVYVYEEMPGLKRTGGITGRGLQGFSDSLLKVFGV
jgi:hypothetical protein